LALTVALSWALRRSLPRRVDRVFRVLQIGSAAAYSLGHGSNDAQKTMGIIVGLLVAEQQVFATGALAGSPLHLTDLNSIPAWAGARTLAAPAAPAASPPSCAASCVRAARRSAPESFCARSSACRTAATRSGANPLDRASWSTYAPATKKLGGQTMCGWSWVLK